MRTNPPLPPAKLALREMKEVLHLFVKAILKKQNKGTKTLCYQLLSHLIGAVLTKSCHSSKCYDVTFVQS